MQIYSEGATPQSAQIVNRDQKEKIYLLGRYKNSKQA